jgi:hypothetical protein
MLIKSIIFLLSLLAVSLFSQVNSGIAEDTLFSGILQFFNGDNASATAIYTALLALIGIVSRIILKKLPTNMNGNVSIVFWHIMAALFGDGVKLENNVDTDAVLQALKKKYPNLDINKK